MPNKVPLNTNICPSTHNTLLSIIPNGATPKAITTRTQPNSISNTATTSCISILLSFIKPIAQLNIIKVKVRY